MCDRQNVISFSQDESEITCEKGNGIGLLTAYTNDAVSISFLYDSYWEKFILECEYFSFSNNKMYPVQVYNLSRAKQLQENKHYLKSLREIELSEIETPKQLLCRLDSLFPSLVFNEVALNQLENEVEVQHLSAILSKLIMLENYFSKWDGKKFEEDNFPTKSVSPQSKETLKRFERRHTYTFPDRQVIVSYHIRYTGNIPGRIYFEPVNDLKKAYICSLTTKLPSVTEPKQKV
jgi:hypothetical protein